MSSTYTFIFADKKYTVENKERNSAMEQANKWFRAMTSGAWMDTQDPTVYKWVEGNFFD
jgi:hypothetical protein